MALERGPASIPGKGAESFCSGLGILAPDHAQSRPTPAPALGRCKQPGSRSHLARSYLRAWSQRGLVFLSGAVAIRLRRHLRGPCTRSRFQAWRRMRFGCLGLLQPRSPRPLPPARATARPAPPPSHAASRAAPLLAGSSRASAAAAAAAPLTGQQPIWRRPAPLPARCQQVRGHTESAPPQSPPKPPAPFLIRSPPCASLETSSGRDSILSTSWKGCDVQKKHIWRRNSGPRSLIVH